MWQAAGRRSDRRGLTIVELLVACGVLGVSFGLLLPALPMTRE